MRKIFIAIALVSLSMSGCNNAGDAEWVPMERGGSAYYNQKTSVRNGDNILVWLRYAGETKGNRNKAFLQIQTELNCKMRTARSVLAVMHEANGTEVKEPLNGSEVSPIMPGTPFNAVAIKLCSATR